MSSSPPTATHDVVPITSTYGDVADLYLVRGWSPLPLPRGKKWPPPDGFTGRSGAEVTEADVAEWTSTHGAGNLAIRLPDSVVGVDVDAYHGGLDTMATVTADLGELPPTWTSTSRDDGSGIRFYRVPEGLRFRSYLLGKDDGVEIIQHRYRYAVVSPSVHPNGTLYEWYAPGSDEPTCDIPYVGDLPDLPETWLAHILRAASEDVDVEAWSLTLDAEEEPSTPLTMVLDEFRAALDRGDDKHGAVLTFTAALVGMSSHPGAATVLDEAMDALTEVRTASEAFREMHNALRGPVRGDVDVVVVPKPWRPSSPRPGALTEADFWSSRESLQHVHDYARATRVNPWALLGAVLARTSAAVPPQVVLPAFVGGSKGSLNYFVALVGKSGAGKGATEDAAREAVIFKGADDPMETALGSGEGLVRSFWDTKAKARNDVQAILFSVAEIDSLAALKGRSGSTLSPTLRAAWTGSLLSFNYADDNKRVAIPAHSYRTAMVAGVQPLRAEVLLEDADGGTPQRFIWLPVLDKDMPEVRPPAVAPRVVRLPFVDHEALRHPDVALAEVRESLPFRYMSVPQSVADEMDAARVKLNRSEGAVDALQGHWSLCRLKTAALLALLDERAEVTEDDWMLSGLVMEKSDETLGTIQAALSEAASRRVAAFGRSDAVREAAKEEAMEERLAEDRAKVAETITAKVTDEWTPWSQVRGGITGRLRPLADDVRDELVDSGVLETRAGKAAAGQPACYVRAAQEVGAAV